MNNRSLAKLQIKYANFNIKPYLKSGLTKFEILQLKEAFDLFDEGYKGYLDLEQLKESLTELGMESKNNEIDKLIVDNITKIDFGGFLNLIGAKASCRSKEEAKKLYCIFLNNDDISQNLSIDDFKRVASDLDLQVAENEIEEMINSLNPSESGYITFEEFYNVMAKIDN